MVDKEHQHTAEDLHRMTSKMHPSVEEYIRKETAAGRHAAKIHLDLKLHVLLQFHEQHIKPNFRDKQFFPSLSQVRATIHAFRNRHMRLALDDVDDVKNLAREYPHFVTILQDYLEGADRVSQHLILHVGGEVERENFNTFGKNNLVLLDATHKFNDVGYRTYTMMAVDLRTNKPRICGHMITSDLTHNSLVVWLKHVCSSGPPAEVLIDCCATETLALEIAFEGQGVHTAYCFFHAMKAILSNIPGLPREKKTVVKALIRRLFLTRDQSEFATVLKKVEEIFAQWPSVKKYWDEFWVPKMEKWANIHRRFPQVRTTNFLESFHQFMKFSGVGAHRQLVRRIGDAIRILLACDISKHLDLCLAISERVHGNSSARIHLKSAHVRAEKLLKEMQQCSHSTFADCQCLHKLVCEDISEGLYSFHTGDDSYDVNMDMMVCSCLAFENRPYLPCKHILAIAKRYAQPSTVKVWLLPEFSPCCSCTATQSEYLKKIEEAYDFKPNKDKEDKLVEQIIQFALMHFRTNPRPIFTLDLAEYGYERDQPPQEQVSGPSQPLPLPPSIDTTCEDRGFGGEEYGEASMVVMEDFEGQRDAEVQEPNIETIRRETQVLLEGLQNFVKHLQSTAEVDAVLRWCNDAYDRIPGIQQPTDRRSSRLYAAHASAHGQPIRAVRGKRKRTDGEQEAESSGVEGVDPQDIVKGGKLSRKREGGFLSVVSQSAPKQLPSSNLEKVIAQGRIDEISGTQMVEIVKAKAAPKRRTAKQRRSDEISQSQAAPPAGVTQAVIDTGSQAGAPGAPALPPHAANPLAQSSSLQSSSLQTSAMAMTMWPGSMQPWTPMHMAQVLQQTYPAALQSYYQIPQEMWYRSNMMMRM
jgi:hypothetical protein